MSTQELQQSHYNFGTDVSPWVTTSQANYHPKQFDVKRYTKDLKKHSFILGDERPNYCSINQEIFVGHKIDAEKTDKKALADDLRSILK